MLELRVITECSILDELYSDPYIKRVSHDYRPAKPIIDERATYVGAWVFDEFLGAFLAIKKDYIDCDVHSLLKKDAVLFSRELGAMFVNWCFENTGAQRLTGYIIEGLESAKNYAKKVGFRQEGFMRDAVVVNGQLVGLHILGMTRKEWETAK